MLISEGCAPLELEEALALISNYLTRSDGEIELVAAGRSDLMKEKTIINAGTEKDLWGFQKFPLFVPSRCRAVGEELTGRESVK